MSTVNKRQIGATLDPKIAATLDDMATRYWGGNKSKAVEWALEIAALVFSHPDTFTRGVPDPRVALEVYCGKAADN